MGEQEQPHGDNARPGSGVASLSTATQQPVGELGRTNSLSKLPDPTFDSPSLRTGPPRSLSYNPESPRVAMRKLGAGGGVAGSASAGGDSQHPQPLTEEDANWKDCDFQGVREGDDTPFRPDAPFRGALEYADPEQRGKEREAAERKEKHRQSSLGGDDLWHIFKWKPAESSRVPSKDENLKERERTSYFPRREGLDEERNLNSGDEGGHDEEHVDEGLEDQDTITDIHTSGVAGPSTSRSKSDVPSQRPLTRRASIMPKWSRLKSLLPTLVGQREHARAGQVAVATGPVNITDELLVGGLSSLMLRLWTERDEHGHRRVPVLLHRLRVRISDSIHPLVGSKTVFRIECEYANGAARWVVYRQLRDFISLHTHYKLSSTFRQNVEALPEFPRTSLPYFKFLKREVREKGKELRRRDFAILQRESLENYLVGLMRAVMFHPSSNRLAGFLEISALSISLAQSGGWQAKGGFLRIDAASSKTGPFGRKTMSIWERRKQRWCAVRESYLVVMDEIGETTVWDVFLLDAQFKIERPVRYYRQGLNLLHVDSMLDDDADALEASGDEPLPMSQQIPSTSKSAFRRIGERVSQTLHCGPNGQNVAERERVEVRRTTSRSQSQGHSQSQHHARVGSLSSSSSASSRSNLADPSTNMNPLEPIGTGEHKAGGKKKDKNRRDVSKHTFYIQNSQMRLKLYAKNERQMQQWITALEKAASLSHWTGNNRFDSFAPIRLNVAAQWLVDGRDYMWNLSRAILLARERIYIHDWWLSPEVLLRRPGKERYRLDKLLERKAKEGVKIYIILYNEVSNRTTPTDSNYSKQTLSMLHENIMVQRSPSHFQTGTYYWAHHEKMCVIDETIAFMGGIDLCFGRWDTPQHVLVDVPDPQVEGSSHIWPGKDYSNARVADFSALEKPEQDMYERDKVPRMPWHDVGLQVVGQPARDLCRHFLERWNYLLRIKNHSRVFPYLVPPPDFKSTELDLRGLSGTCEMQICRSSGPWSMGSPNRTESSIHNAYLKAIQFSEHFVYIENQFFITSTSISDTRVENKIGDALVHRIIRAHRQGDPWKACIVIPLLPGFPFSIDHNDASALRIILGSQNRTICRGQDSIFSRLRKRGIDPNDYISFFSLRTWAKLPGDVPTTEQVYIHGKVCIVDDRLAIIGSANINERSMRGDRDSELAAIIRDTDMIDGTMAGKPFKVGRFAHSLRVRLMREHLGVDVDSLYEEDLMAKNPDPQCEEPGMWDPDHEQEAQESGFTKAGPAKLSEGMKRAAEALRGTGHETGNPVGSAAMELKPSISVDREGGGEQKSPRSEAPPNEKLTPEASGSSRTNLGAKVGSTPRDSPPEVDPHGFEDPLCDKFWKDVWMACATQNTEIYRKVFHCIPDDTVSTWKQYKEFNYQHDRSSRVAKETPEFATSSTPTELGLDFDGVRTDSGRRSRATMNSSKGSEEQTGATNTKLSGDTRNGRLSTDARYDRREREEMEPLLQNIRGHLVVYPMHFLEAEDNSNNFIFNADRIFPMSIYV